MRRAVIAQAAQQPEEASVSVGVPRPLLASFLLLLLSIIVLLFIVAAAAVGVAPGVAPGGHGHQPEQPLAPAEDRVLQPWWTPHGGQLGGVRRKPAAIRGAQEAAW